MDYQLSLSKIKQKLSKKYAFDGILLLTIFIAGYLILSKLGLMLHDPVIKQYILGTGIFGALIFALLYELSIVIAPLPGFPLVIMGFGIFGIYQTVLLNYSLSLLGGALNFYIARRWGRPVIAKLIGQRGLERVDSHVNQFSTEMLILTRLFDGFLFEWVSYAAGLTQISFKKYILITIIFSIPYDLIALYIAQRITDLGELFISLSVVYYATLSLPFLYFICKRLFLHTKRRYSAYRLTKAG